MGEKNARIKRVKVKCNRQNAREILKKQKVQHGKDLNDKCGRGKIQEEKCKTKNGTEKSKRQSARQKCRMRKAERKMQGKEGKRKMQ